MTTIKIDFYKAGGRWYTDDTFNTDIPVFETTQLIDAIEKLLREKSLLTEMYYTVEATDKDNCVNKFLVKK